MRLSSSFISALRQCLQESIRVGLLVSAILTFIVMALNNFAQAGDLPKPGNTDSESITHPGQMKSGSLLFRDDGEYHSAPLLHTDVHIVVTGMIARAKVKQSFRNPGREWKEGVYVFPLPETAAVDHMRMHIGERIIEGQIKEKEVAKKQYHAARKAGKRASLVEQERANIFTTSVANIGPGETIVVEIEYQQLTKYDMGKFSLRFPTVVAPRYIPGTTHISGFAGSGWAKNTDIVADAARITPPVNHPAHGKINPVSMRIDLHAGFKLEDINSPFHKINLVRDGDSNTWSISLEENTVPADRDFVLNWKARAGDTPQAALFRENLDAGEYALLMLLPPERQQELVLKREIIFVIDTSGSMAGTSIVQAKSALQLALSRLKTGDRFNIIQFNSYTSSLFPAPEDFSSQSLQQAGNYINSLQANGGTEMATAIRAALSNQDYTKDVRQVVFLTDGSVGNEDALFREIEQLLGNSRLFTIGIGSAPNSHFMKRAARFGRGTHTYIGNTAQVQEKMGELFSKLESPVLSDISVHIPASQVEIWPQQIPDLYIGEPLLLSIKSKALPGVIELAGKIADANWKTSLSLKGGQQRPGVSGLWARRKISALMDQDLHGSEQDQLRQEIVSTALEHHLVSKYTSLFAVDITPVRKQQEYLQKHAMAVNLPAGWKHEKVFGSMPRTATPATSYFFIGALLLLLSFLLRRVGAHV